MNVPIKTGSSLLKHGLSALQESLVEHLDLVRTSARLLLLFIAQVVTAIVMHSHMLAEDLMCLLLEDRRTVCLERNLIQRLLAALLRNRS